MHRRRIFIFVWFLLDRHDLYLGLLGNVVEISTQQLSALNVVALVKLLVDGVGTIGRASHGQQQDILASSLFKSQGNGNATI